MLFMWVRLQPDSLLQVIYQRKMKQCENDEDYFIKLLFLIAVCLCPYRSHLVATRAGIGCLRRMLGPPPAAPANHRSYHQWAEPTHGRESAGQESENGKLGKNEGFQK